MLILSTIARKIGIKKGYSDDIFDLPIKPAHKIANLNFLNKERFMQVIDIVRKNGEADIYEMGGGWGNRIKWNDIENREVVGWKPVIPRKGDLLKCEMASGDMGVYAFIDIERQSNPQDMFFGKVAFVGYEK